MVEHGTVGGTCVNIGCVPSKAMLRAGEIYDFAGRNPHRGAPTLTGPVELGELVAQKDGLVERMRREKYCDLIGEYGWELVKGHAEFADPETLLVDERPLRARRYVIASGARPTIPPIEGLEEAGYVTSTSGLELKELPKRLLVVGGNYVGLEMGQLYAHLGAEVVLFEMLERISPLEEPEVAETLAAILESEDPGRARGRPEDADGDRRRRGAGLPGRRDPDRRRAAPEHRQARRRARRDRARRTGRGSY